MKKLRFTFTAIIAILTVGCAANVTRTEPATNRFWDYTQETVCQPNLEVPTTHLPTLMQNVLAERGNQAWELISIIKATPDARCYLLTFKRPRQTPPA